MRGAPLFLARRHRSSPAPNWLCFSRHRKEVIDRCQHGQQHKAETQTPDNQLLLHRQQRFDRYAVQLFIKFGLSEVRHDTLLDGYGVDWLKSAVSSRAAA